jgi:hypothetical protein
MMECVGKARVCACSVHDQRPRKEARLDSFRHVHPGVAGSRLSKSVVLVYCSVGGR